MALAGKISPSVPSTVPPDAPPRWQKSLAEAIRDPALLITRLDLPESLLDAARRNSGLFSLLVPESYLRRMSPRNIGDPLLRQVLPVESEQASPAGYTTDAVGDGPARRVPGLLHKYRSRALLMVSGVCAVHCRYCFRRHYPYGDEPSSLEEWASALDEIAGDDSLQEVILSGGDPLIWSDHRLAQLIDRLAEIPHVRRLRIHSRLPVVLPNRVTRGLLDAITRQRQLQPIMVVHANHPHEVVDDCAEALRRLVRSGVPTLNQTVLLKGVNDCGPTLLELSERLVNLGVIPYYLHQLDRVAGTAHFEVTDETAKELHEHLRSHLPGYAVPQLVREIAGAPYKVPVT